jgi:hypothetical protein
MTISDDVVAQYEQTMSNIDVALKQAGASMACESPLYPAATRRLREMLAHPQEAFGKRATCRNDGPSGTI